MELTGKQKRFLRSLGHGLKPMVNLGKQGINPAVVRQVGESLTAHELIKIKVMENCPLDRDAAAGIISTETGAVLVQTIGRTLLMYRPHPEQPEITLPGPAQENP
ncbi:MAG: ribosome assembly RNA-binding protein YhbY [Deltaproteobacteria bacterium]|nr:ribosome assembly RNA-binding protein YhbY [Deltaproteobacteria bacterium]